MSWDTTDLSFKILVNKQVTSDTKKYYEEFGADTINAHVQDLWTQGIPYNDPAAAVAQGVVQQYTLQVLTWDNTVPNNQCYYAFDGANKLRDWVSDKYGALYAIHLYQNDGVTEIFPTDVSQWFFNYQTGILIFNGSTASHSKPYKITGYRYIGTKGITGILGMTGPLGGSTGVAGITGLMGVTGLIGETGVQGITGLIGETGPQGVTGLIGETGVQGITGLIGETGPQGITGLIGETGSQGITGLFGETGVQGITGIMGVDGVTGVAGITGLIGETGVQGITGIYGETGVQGVTGYFGETGVQGGTGVAGITGLIGPIGATGLPGADGGNAGRIYYLDPQQNSDIPGYYVALRSPSPYPEAVIDSTVSDSVDVLIGSFATDSSGIGVYEIPAGTAFRHIHGSVSDETSIVRFRVDALQRDGTNETLLRSSYSQNFSGTVPSEIVWNFTDGSSYACDPSTRVIFNVYASRVSGSDPVVVSSYFDGTARASYIQTTVSAGAVGPQGITGLQGVQGLTGFQGVTGFLGETGPQGITGLFGETGVQGVTGYFGETGIQGLTGEAGITGLMGVTGYFGETGLQGVTGIYGETGVQGITGLAGDTGIQGVTGYFGETGPQGLTGLFGETGVQGVTGIYGETGVQGVTGLIGETGPQGVTGIYGDTGIQGIQGVTGIMGIDGGTGLYGQTGIQGITGGVGIYYASELPLGVPTDGSYTDGMFQWDASTWTADAIDDLNEILLAIAPTPPLGLSGPLTLSGVTKYTAILPSSLAVAWYQDSSNAGDTVVDYVITNTYTMDNSNPANEFKVGSTFTGDVGTVYHVLNGSNGSYRDMTQGVGTTGNIQITSLATYNSIWRKANARISYTQPSEGYSRHAMRYIAGTVNQITDNCKFWYDDVNGTPGFPSGGTVTQNTLSSTRYLSGIRYYAVGDTFDMTSSVTNIAKKGIKPTNPITYSMPGMASTNIAIPGATFDWDATYNFDVVNKALDTANIYNTDAKLTITGTKPAGTTASTTTASQNRLINTYPVPYSSNCNIYMFDEAYRWKVSNDFNLIPANYSNPTGDWTSSDLLSNGNGQLYNTTWYYPSINYTSGYLPTQTANYSGFSGDQTIMWACNIGNAHSSMTIAFTGINYTAIAAEGSGNLNISIRLPQVHPSFAPNDWMDCGKSFGNGNGCRNDLGSSGSTLACTFGTSSSSDSTGVVYIRVVMKNGSAGVASRMVISGT